MCIFPSKRGKLEVLQSSLWISFTGIKDKPRVLVEKSKSPFLPKSCDVKLFPAVCRMKAACLSNRLVHGG